MGTTLNHKDIATPKSGHGCVTTIPATSIAPPTPPAGPAPAPFPYVARSATAEGTEPAFKANEQECLVELSEMKVDMPGNKVSEVVKGVGGGDVVTHAICGIAVMAEGSGGTSSGGKRVCRTMDNVRMCLVMASQQVAQATVPLLLAGGGAFAGDKGTGIAKKEENVRTALAAQAAHSGNKTKGPSKPDLESDPVAVATGSVVDEAVDLALPGAIPLVWRRTYASDRARERTSLGCGGWAHSFEQWVKCGEERMIYRAGDGRDIYFPVVTAGQTAFHRGERLTLTSNHRGGYVILERESGRSLDFEPIDDGGRAVLRGVRDTYGHALTLVYDGHALVRIIDTAGRELRILSRERRIERLEVWAAAPVLHEAAGRPGAPQDQAEKMPAPCLVAWVDYAYYPEGDLESATDALGHADRYAYDGLHRLVRKTLKSGLSFHYTYDPDTGRCEVATGDGGAFAVRFAYDLAKRTTRASGTYEPRLYTWDARGVVTRIEAPGTLITERVYDDDLYLVSEINGAGEARTFEYDTEGRCTKAVDPAGNALTWVYDGEGSARRIDAAGHEVRFSYDGHGALVRVEREGGGITLDRDRDGRVVAVQGRDGTIAAFAYDALGNMVETTNERGAKACHRFDALGRVIELADAQGVMRVTYDAIGRIVALSFSDGTERLFEYDAAGNICREVDRAGRVTTREYTPIGQLAAVTTPDGQRWAFEHDADGRLSVVKNPRCETYRFVYDRLGRVERETTFDGRVMEYWYDKAGRVARINFPDGSYRELSHDALGNVVESRAPDGTVTYTCDALGRIEKAAIDDLAGKHAISVERDEHGRVTAETQGTRTIRFTYDDRGRRASRTVEGRTTRYFYDTSGLLTALDHEGYRVLLYRDPAGREVRRHLYRLRGDVLSAYDASGRLIAQRATAGEASQVLVDRRYSYAAIGGLVRVDDARWGTTSYRYDAMDRLIEALHPKLTETFVYDVNGELASALRGGEVREPAPWGTRPGNVLVRAGEALFANDDRGQRVEKVEKDASGALIRTTYAWDSRGQLREVLLPNGERVVLWYDAFGRRVRKAVYPSASQDLAKLVTVALEHGKEALPKPRVTEYLWDGDALAAEIGPDGTCRVYVCEPGALAPMLHENDGAVVAYVHGPLGVPKELLDEEGRVAWSAVHGAFGSVVTTFRDPRTKREVDTPFRLLGQTADPETGLHAARHRVFDPAVGRWCSPDPLGLVGGVDLFGYNGSPTRDVDPLGLAICTSITRTREEALADARERAGLPRDAEPVETFVKRPGFADNKEAGEVGFNPDMSISKIRSQLGALGPVEVHFNPNDPTGNTVVVIANHSYDPVRPPHVHAGTISANDYKGRYTAVPTSGDEHIYYGPLE
jgi:RHS repeat-associated protein